MIFFNCDYNEGAHPEIIRRLTETNFEQTPGYGEDRHCELARSYIKKACSREDTDIHFLVGGTQANLTVISAALRPHQGVLCAESGHINVHESGAVEAVSHKVIALPAPNGKITSDQIRSVYRAHKNDESREHAVQVKMVYISFPTELGTLYSKNELYDISRACCDCNYYLYLDGARLGYGLASRKNDLTLSDIARCCDVFYIGGTKVGALFGEAVVISAPAVKEDFRYIIKQKGGLLAKGRLLGIQFETLFENKLYESISAHAIELSDMISDALFETGVRFLVEPATNQLFPILPNPILALLREKYYFNQIEKYDGEEAVRICTGWATRREDAETLVADIRAAYNMRK